MAITVPFRKGDKFLICWFGSIFSYSLRILTPFRRYINLDPKHYTDGMMKKGWNNWAINKH